MLQISAQDRETLLTWVRATTAEQRLVTRARIILELAKGSTNEQVARRLELRAATVSKWRGRFTRQGPAGLCDEPRSGKPPTYTHETEMRVLSTLDTPPPDGYAQWNGSLIAQALGDVSTSQVWRILRVHSISLQRRRSWCVSTDPQFAEKAADVVGLYLDPPDNAVVICVDEKPHIQALERAQGWLRLPDGRALTGFAHEYKRHGTTTLFAALTVATGMVTAGHYNRRRRVEFLDFMNGVVAEHPDEEIHVILDNLNTHKPKRDMWLARHRNVHFHYTPTHASWLNQIKVWFSILSRAALRGASFTSPGQVRDAIDAFVNVYNKDVHPFEWRKAEVRQTKPERKYADLCR
jgi:transposase